MQTLEEVDVKVIETFKDQSKSDAHEEAETLGDLDKALEAMGYAIPIEIIQQELRRHYVRFEFFKRHQVAQSPMTHPEMEELVEKNVKVLTTFLTYAREFHTTVEAAGELMATLTMISLIKYGEEHSLQIK